MRTCCWDANHVVDGWGRHWCEALVNTYMYISYIIIYLYSKIRHNTMHWNFRAHSKPIPRVKSSTAKASEQTGGWMNGKARGIYYIIQCVGWVQLCVILCDITGLGCLMFPHKKRLHSTRNSALKALAEPPDAASLVFSLLSQPQMKWASWKRLQEIERRVNGKWVTSTSNVNVSRLYRSKAWLKCSVKLWPS